MKIVLLIDWFLYYSVELANALVDGNEVLLVTRDHNYEISSDEAPVRLENFLEDCLSKKVRHEVLRFRRSDLRNLMEIRRVFREMKKNRPDVLHVQENSDWRIFLISWLFGFRRTVLTVHDVHRHPGETARVSEWLTRRFRRKAAAVIVHGEHLKDELMKESIIFEKKTTVIPHGAFGIFRRWEEKEIRREEKHTALLFGRMTAYKGIDVILEAEPMISQEIPDFKVILAGRGPELERVRPKIAHNPHIEVHDRFIVNEEIPSLFRRAGIVVLPYTEASQSGVIPLAYAFGKPVIVSSVGSISEVVRQGETGLIISPNDPKKLAESVIHLFNEQKLRESMGRKAYEMAQTELSWKNVAAKTSMIYSHLIDR